jgi:hypothetical protein
VCVGFVMCGYVGNMCTCIYCVLYFLNFIFIYLYVFCIACTVFLFCFVYVYLFLFVLSVLV